MMEIRALVMKYRLPTFLCAVIVLAFVLVVISMRVYYVSGAAQLDLSRPEYMAVRSQITVDTKEKDTFEAQGEVNDAVLEEFLLQYKEKTGTVIELNAFSGDALEDEQLGLK